MDSHGVRSPIPPAGCSSTAYGCPPPFRGALRFTVGAPHPWALCLPCLHLMYMRIITNSPTKSSILCGRLEKDGFSFHTFSCDITQIFLYLFFHISILSNSPPKMIVRRSHPNPDTTIISFPSSFRYFRGKMNPFALRIHPFFSGRSCHDRGFYENGGFAEDGIALLSTPKCLIYFPSISSGVRMGRYTENTAPPPWRGA